MIDLRQEREMWKIKLPVESSQQGILKESVGTIEKVRWFNEEELGYSLSEVPDAVWFGDETSTSRPTPLDR